MERCFFHLISGLDIGGCEVMLANAVPDLRGGRHVVIVHSNRTSALEQQLENRGIEVYFLNARSLFDLAAIRKFRALVKRYRPVSISTYLLAANFFGRTIGRLCGIRNVYCFVRSKHSPRRYLPYWIAERMTAFLVTHYFTVSNEVKDFYHRVLRLPNKKMTVIHNGVDLEKFRTEFMEERLHRSLNLEKNSPVIGCVGKLRLEEKGQNYLVEAMGAVVRTFPTARLLLVGDGQDRERIEKQIEELRLEKNVELLGDRGDIPELLATMDVFVMPSLFEGMCNAIVEAMAASRAIVASDLPENRELVTHNESALLVPPKNSDALADAIIQLLHNPEKRRQLGEAAHRTGQKFSRTIMLKKMNRLYVSAEY